MDDLRKRVISSLETLKQDFPKIISWQYDDQLQNTVSNIELAITLLKAQEPIEPIKHLSTGQICGSCKKVLLRKYKYCPECGKAVKWE